MEEELPSIPAKIRHQQLTMERTLRILQRKNAADPQNAPDELNFKLTFNADKNEWVFIVHAFTAAIIEEESCDIVVEVPFRHHHGKWVRWEPRIIENGVRDDQFGGDLEDAIKRLMGGGSQKTGDLTGSLSGGTSNKGFGSSEVRKVTVIRT